MSIVWLEGFETGSNATALSRKYFGGESEVSPSSLQAGRHGGKCIRSQGTDAWTLGTTSTGQRNSLVCGLAVRGSNVYDGHRILEFQGLGIAALAIEQHVYGDNQIKYSFHNKGVELYRTPAYDAGIWVYLEAWVLFETEITGINTIFRVNGMVCYADRIVNGINPALPGYDRFYISGRGGSGGYADMDDFYVLDHTETGPYSFPQDSPRCVIQTLHPSSAGSNTEWTVSGAPSNTEALDDSRSETVNDDTDYVVGDSATELELHLMDEPTFVGDQIYGVEFEWDARADDSEGTADMQFLMQSGLQNPVEVHAQANVSFIEAGYSRARFQLASSPVTGFPFDLEELRGFQLGFGAKENFTPLVQSDEEPGDGDGELSLNYGTASNPTGSPLDFGTASNPSGPNVDLGNA